MRMERAPFLPVKPRPQRIVKSDIRRTAFDLQRGCMRGPAFAGFTLIEVLVAVVILATGMVLILRAFETSLVAMGASRDAVRASALIPLKLAELRSEIAEGGSIRQSGSGVFDDPYGDYLWRIERRAWRSAAGGGSNAVEEVVVGVRRAGSSTEYTVSTMMRTAP